MSNIAASPEWSSDHSELAIADGEMGGKDEVEKEEEVEVIVISDTESDDGTVECLGVKHPEDSVIIISSDDDHDDEVAGARSGSPNPYSRPTYFVTDSEDEIGWDDCFEVKRAKRGRRQEKYEEFYAFRDAWHYRLSSIQLWREWDEVDSGAQYPEMDEDYFRFCEQYVKPEFGGPTNPTSILSRQNRRDCGLEETDDSEESVQW